MGGAALPRIIGLAKRPSNDDAMHNSTIHSVRPYQASRHGLPVDALRLRGISGARRQTAFPAGTGLLALNTLLSWMLAPIA
jgi:hypothetical protein